MRDQHVGRKGEEAGRVEGKDRDAGQQSSVYPREELMLLTEGPALSRRLHTPSAVPSSGEGHSLHQAGRPQRRCSWNRGHCLRAAACFREAGSGCCVSVSTTLVLGELGQNSAPVIRNPTI